jgi:hypothetical protein
MLSSSRNEISEWSKRGRRGREEGEKRDRREEGEEEGEKVGVGKGGEGRTNAQTQSF